MLVLWYSPFPDGSFTDSVTQFVADTTTKIVHKNTAKYYKFKAHLPNGQDELKDLPSGTRLYIIGHGDTSQGHISGDKPVALAAVPKGFSSTAASLDQNRRLTLTPVELADLLTAQGGALTGVTQIKLWSCIAAKGADSFVEAFARIAMERWPQAEVFGYTDYMVFGAGKKRGAIMKEFDSRPASKSKVNMTAKLRKKSEILEIYEDEDDSPPFDDDPFNNPFVKVGFNPLANTN